MPVPERLRDRFIAVLSHLEGVMTRMTPRAGTRRVLFAVDRHTVAEGLLLYAFTHWEEFTRDLLIEDVATDAASAIHRAVRTFRDRAARRRLALRLLQHPDHPRRFIEWSNYDDIVSRANEFIGATNRFAAPPLPQKPALKKLKVVRNAVAHRSDKAWTDFLNLCADPPFSIPAAQMRRMTPGRFLLAHSWNGQPVLRETLALLESAARHLVP